MIYFVCLYMFVAGVVYYAIMSLWNNNAMFFKDEYINYFGKEINTLGVMVLSIFWLPITVVVIIILENDKKNNII